MTRSFRYWSPLSLLVVLMGCVSPDSDRRTRVGDSSSVALPLVRLTHSGARNGQAAWSPDGATIAFVSNRSGSWQIWSIDAAGGDARRVTDSPDPVGWPSWVGSGERILYYAGTPDRYQMWSIGGDGSGNRPLLRSQHSDFRPSLAPNGKHLLFDRFGASDPPNHDLYVADLEIGEVRALTSDPGYDSDARWSPDGRLVLFQSDRHGDAPYDVEIYLIGADGTGLRQLTDGPDRHLYPVWCPNGEWIAYVRDQEGRRDVWVSELATGRSRALIDLPGTDDSPIWSPDGTRLLFATDHFGAGHELALIDTPFCAAGREAEGQ